jgi:hypothetical protein
MAFAIIYLPLGEYVYSYQPNYMSMLLPKHGRSYLFETLLEAEINLHWINYYTIGLRIQTDIVPYLNGEKPSGIVKVPEYLLEIVEV